MDLASPQSNKEKIQHTDLAYIRSELVDALKPAAYPEAATKRAVIIRSSLGGGNVLVHSSDNQTRELFHGSCELRYTIVRVAKAYAGGEAVLFA